MQPSMLNSSLTYFNPRSPHGERHDPFDPVEMVDNFNPRSPHGERLDREQERAKTLIFQSTLPARGATEVQHE